MKLTNIVDDAIGIVFGFAIVGVVAGVFGTAIIMAYLTDTRLFAGRPTTLS